jgi:hypothetical protein
MEADDKPIRLKAASWIEPTGAAVFFDDFLGDTLNTFNWVATSTATGTAWAVSSTAGDPVAAHGGWIKATTDNVDASAEELGSMAATTVGNWRPDRAGNGLLVFEARVSKPDALTTTWCVVGLSDDESEGAALAMSLSTVTWTTTAVDAIAWGLYSTATDNDNWIAQAVDTNVDDTHVASTIAAAADTATKLRIELDTAGVGYVFQDGIYQGILPTGVTPTIPLIPYIGVGGTTTTSTSLEVDYVLVACGR